MNSKNKIKVFETTDLLFQSACDYILEIAENAIIKRKRFTIALSGGSTPEQLYTLLSKPEICNKIKWENTFVFWGDERCVALNSLENNAHNAKSLLLNKVNIPPSNIFPIPVNLTPEKAAMEYEKTINDFFDESDPFFDLILLGLGEDGHTASLFPMSAVIEEHQHIVKEVYLQEKQTYRITMTASFINLAHHILFLVTGEKKAAILEKIFTAPYQPNLYPAQLINPINGELLWFIDKTAASKLNTSD